MPRSWYVRQFRSQLKCEAESFPRNPETAVITAANVDLSTVSKPDDGYTPPSRPHDGDTYVRKRPASVRHSARNSKTIAVQHGSHQSVRIALPPGQSVTRVSSQRVQHTSSPIAIPDASRRASYILASDRDDDYPLHHSISPPLIGMKTKKHYGAVRRLLTFLQFKHQRLHSRPVLALHEQ